jgi:hypothetical protein
LAGAIELVSPANKDRPAHRDAFASKCHSYLQQGVGLVIIDVVTSRSENMHQLVLKRLEATAQSTIVSKLYASAYRLLERDSEPVLDIWEESIALGSALPSMPLWLGGGLCLEVELEAAYERACHEQRIAEAMG